MSPSKKTAERLSIDGISAPPVTDAEKKRARKLIEKRASNPEERASLLKQIFGKDA